jgi:SAM-dependent methyltransferase
MGIRSLQKLWDALGRTDPLWAVLTDPSKKGNRWRLDEFFQTGGREISSLMAHVDALGVDLSRKRALDFGCGVGRLSQALVEHFEEVRGVDIAPSMIARAEEYNRYGPRCRYHLNDTGDLSLFSDDTFDLVYSNITLQHIPPPFAAAYIDELVRVLAPRGLLIFQLPSGPAPEISRRPKERLKSVLPAGALALYYSLTQPLRAEMTMHPIPREEVVRRLEGRGARLLDVSPDESAGEGWVGFRYCATKG